MLIWEIIVVVGVVLIDIATKVLAALFMREKISLIDGVFSFVYVENTGASFGMMKGQRWLFVAITVVALMVMLFWLAKNKKAHRLARIAMLLIAGGAFGNMFDRIVYGYVRDFLYFELINFPVFNVADCALTVGVTLLVIYVLFIYKEPQKDLSSGAEEKSDNEGVSNDGTQL